MLHTTIPTRSRSEVLTYEVQTGDTLFIIADNFGINAETILFGNFDFLNGNPHLLAPGDVLNILPINGAYHLWSEGDTLEKIAETYFVEQDIIVQWPGNNLDPYELEFNDNPIQPGTWLVIPGGQRDDYVDWGPPAISRSNPVSASYYGSGYCGQIYEGAVGTYNFIWPTSATYISAFYNPVLHPAIDIAASIGYPVFASDTGVVVYAGWSVYGYGNLVVIDHGNGWQSAYAHLDTIRVSCGQSVYQGSTIGTMGNTGQSTGPHLHFELLSDIYGKVDPLLYASP
jgi:murein DD-endopeptidase MepM/ murein hydrolase activator NlpD